MHVGGRVDILLQILKAHAIRCVYWLLITVSFSFSYHAKAESTAATITWKYGVPSSPVFTSSQDALAAHSAYNGCSTWGFWSGNTWPMQTGQCLKDNSWNHPVSATGSASCPVDAENPWTLEGDKPANFVCTRDSVTPPPLDCEDRQGQLALEGDFTDSDRDGSLTEITCVDSCQAVLSSSGPGGPTCSYGESGVGICEYTIHGVYIYTGASCSGGEASPSPAPPPDSSCPQCDCFESGGSWGSVNGLSTCVPQGVSGAAPVTTTQPPTTTTETPPPTPENPNPEPVVTTQPGVTITVTAPPAGAPAGSEPQVTETTQNPDGSTTTKTSSKSGYCQQNPNAKLCKDGGDSFFAGSCSASFTCEGDAIQCAIAREQHIRNCELFESETPQSELGEAMVAGTDDGAKFNPSQLANREIVNVSASLDASNGGISGSVQDVVIAVPDGSITLPFTSWIPFLEICGYFVLGFAYFRAYKTVGGV